MGWEEGAGARTGASSPLISQQKGSLDVVYKGVFPLGNSVRRRVTNLDNSQVKKRILSYPQKKHFKGTDRVLHKQVVPFWP